MAKRTPKRMRRAEAAPSPYTKRSKIPYRYPEWILLHARPPAHTVQAHLAEQARHARINP
jgi:hypothetical protein